MQKLSKKNYTKIGILGGTFDPPHFGHVEICKIAIKKLKLKKVFWVATNKNPFKLKANFKLKTRIKLSKKILGKQKKIRIKNTNKILSSKSTYSILKYLKNKNKKIEFFFLMGADNLINFHKWHNWRKIPTLAKVVVFARPNFSIKALKSVASKKLSKKDWIYINFTKFDISSSKIKKI